MYINILYVLYKNVNIYIKNETFISKRVIFRFLLRVFEGLKETEI